MRMKLSCVKIRNNNSEFITIIKIYILMDIIFIIVIFISLMVKILLGVEGVMIVKIFENTILFVLCLVILSGCFTREGTIVGGKVHGSSDSVSGSISGDYRKFTGSATQDRKVKKGENWIFLLMIKLNKEL